MISYAVLFLSKPFILKRKSVDSENSLDERKLATTSQLIRLIHALANPYRNLDLCFMTNNPLETYI